MNSGAPISIKKPQQHGALYDSEESNLSKSMEKKKETSYY